MAEIEKKPIKITETILRDAHQSLIATRMTTEQMLPIIDKMDQVGYHSVECWGGATFDAFPSFFKRGSVGSGSGNSGTALKIQNSRCCSADRTSWDTVRMLTMW